ncbi:hypothetical protein PHO31112_04124 [Pandoraea horticolens]|uniref:Uncharacterized protein n=1 Tax=Pandoraea horticolens TaxID=2508298 RepID=A0A5E4XW73_9BURK|nr:DUF995 domain-containing protein [Pandoraea horticolens]VVE40580.1 hypothetical protein PHO31112_04124 [Pandoraea horticolens]
MVPRFASPITAFLASGLLALSTFVYADPMRLSDLKDANGRQLSVDDLRSLMPGAHITNVINNGSTRKWINKTNGTLNATSDNKGNLGSGGRLVQVAHATGTWSVNDNGSYCVNLEWRALTENWCRFMFKVGDKYYGVTSLANGAAITTEFTIEK